jgi:hypothetical protein
MLRVAERDEDRAKLGLGACVGRDAHRTAPVVDAHERGSCSDANVVGACGVVRDAREQIRRDRRCAIARGSSAHDHVEVREPIGSTAAAAREE